jgi:pyruvate dehydrogenase E2 component (dihydrolipoamide acetyltransferase)
MCPRPLRSDAPFPSPEVNSPPESEHGMTEVIMPKMGDAMEEGTLLEWLKKEGDTVKSGETIGTIQTDKATLELEAPGSGTLSGVLVQGGETVPVGKPIAAILREGEKLPEGWGSSNGKTGAQTQTQPSGSSTEGASSQSTAGVSTPEQAPTPQPSEGRVVASPLAKKIARERGIDLSTISGSGPNGRITEKDVLDAQSAPTPVPSAPPTAQIATVQPAAEDQVVQLNRLRQITAQRTAQAKQQIPHFYVTVQVDVEKLSALKEQFEAEGGKISFNDLIIRACALALIEMPQVNSVYQGQTLIQHGAVHIGMAVALEDGLTVPVLKDVQSMSLRQISQKARELAGKARENKLHPDELSGSTFSISNMGMLDVDDFIAIINQPNAGILAVSSVRKQVVVGEDDELEVRRRMNITGSFDHRIVDGAVGARFMNTVKGYLENPTRLLS